MTATASPIAPVPSSELATQGLSPKAILAFLFPFLSALAVSVISWIATGDFSDNEIRTALGGLVASALAAVGAYVGKPGDVADNSLPTYLEGVEAGPYPIADKGDGAQAPGTTTFNSNDAA